MDALDLRNCKVDASGSMGRKKTIFVILTAADEVATLQAASENEM